MCDTIKYFFIENILSPSIVFWTLIKMKVDFFFCSVFNNKINLVSIPAYYKAFPHFPATATVVH